MKREEIKAIFADATDEQLKDVMDLNGADVEKVKSKVTALETELKETKEDKDKLMSELDELKTANASGEDWKAKFEALQSENIAKEKQALAEKAEREREENNRSMFNKAVEAYGKKPEDWNGKFTENGYYNEFIKAVELEENTGRAHKDILHDLVKDDAAAFKGVTTVKLAGGVPKAMGDEKPPSRAAELAAQYQANLYGVKKEN